MKRFLALVILIVSTAPASPGTIDGFEGTWGIKTPEKHSGETVTFIRQGVTLKAAMPNPFGNVSITNVAEANGTADFVMSGGVTGTFKCYYGLTPFPDSTMSWTVKDGSSAVCAEFGNINFLKIADAAKDDETTQLAGLLIGKSDTEVETTEIFPHKSDYDIPGPCQQRTKFMNAVVSATIDKRKVSRATISFDVSYSYIESTNAIYKTLCYNSPEGNPVKKKQMVGSGTVSEKKVELTFHFSNFKHDPSLPETAIFSGLGFDNHLIGKLTFAGTIEKSFEIGPVPWNRDISIR